jgi:hypothetical protein
VSRYRLRFLLQEIDLPQGETLVGRSATCHVTIEDPLVSRQHAKILIEGTRASIEDLGSRNGMVINGRQTRGPLDLSDGDRIRIGTQELVFCAVRAPSRTSPTAGTRPTGFMCHCAACGLPYPMEAPQCPSCGSNERMDEDTVSGVIGEVNPNWTLELLVQVLVRATSLHRWDEPVSREHLDQLASAAASLAEARQLAEWGQWLLGVYATLGMVPPPGITDRLSTLPPAERASLGPAAYRLLESVQARGGPSAEDRAGVSGIESLMVAGDGS